MNATKTNPRILRRRGGHSESPSFPSQGVRDDPNPTTHLVSTVSKGRALSDDTPEKKEGDFNLTVLVVLGWILPLAGFVWGPGEWWAYVLWLAIGTALIAAYDRWG